MLHIVPGLVFLVLGPLQFVTTLRTRRPKVHRRIGYIVLTRGLVTGVTALAMTTQMAIGGATERAATTLFGNLFLINEAVAKIVAMRHLSAEKAERSDHLSQLKEVIEATDDLRAKSGKLSANNVAFVFGLSVAELAALVGRTRQAVSKT